MAYAGTYCRGTSQTRYEEYERRPENREPHVITWDAMKKELYRQLEEQLYMDEMYNRWEKASQCNGQTRKGYGVYLLSIRSNLLNLDAVATPKKT